MGKLGVGLGIAAVLLAIVAATLVPTQTAEACHWGNVYLVDLRGDGNFSFRDHTWSVQLYPGETKQITIKLTNRGKNTAIISPMVEETYPEMNCRWSKHTWSLGKHKSVYLTLKVTASMSAAPGPYRYHCVIKTNPCKK